MKPTAFAVVEGDGIIGYACCHCRELMSTNDGLVTMTHHRTGAGFLGFIRKKASICPFAGKTFKVPVFDLEEV